MSVRVPPAQRYKLHKGNTPYRRPKDRSSVGGSSDDLKSLDIRGISKRATDATKPHRQSQNNMKQQNQANVHNETSKPSAVQKDHRSQYVTRESVLMLLSDDEVAAVATAETAARLADGDEYLDMEQLDQGVQRAHQKKSPMGRVLPKKSIHENTWQKILKQLPARPAAKVDVA